MSETARTEDWTTPGVEEVAAGVHRIPLPLPNDNLRAVNVYTIADGDGLLLIDSGWAIPDRERHSSGDFGHSTGPSPTSTASS